MLRDPEIFFTSMTSMWFIFEPRSVIQSHSRKESLSVSVMEDEHAIVLLLHSVCWAFVRWHISADGAAVL